jgi:hypothetical protein
MDAGRLAMRFDSWCKRSLAAIALLVIAISGLTCGPPVGREPAEKPKAEAVAARPRVLVTISKEATYITEPLRPDGYPDYVAALNQRLSRGVTPENNSAVLLWKAMGPPYYNDRHRNSAFFKMLGIPPLSEHGHYFVDLDKYVRGLSEADLPADRKWPENPVEEAWEQQKLAMQRPWSRKEFPMLAGWLAANEKPLTLVVKSSKLPRRYDPICCESEGSNLGLLAHVFDLVP